MRNGFTFNGKHTNEFGNVTVKTKDRPIFPAIKEAVYSAAEMNGEYDFSEVSGHEYFETRKFQVDLQISAENLEQLQKKVSAISKWLKGRGTLIFDDIPLVKWNARVVDSISFMPQNSGKNAVLSVTYKVMPFSELIFDVVSGPCLDEDIELDTNYPISAAEYLTFGNAGTYRFVPNVSDVPVKPVITVTGATGTFTIGNNGQNITVKYTGDFVIDCEKEQVYSGDKNLMPYTNGDFFELETELDNKITIVGSGTVQINYTPQFLYDVDLNNMKWGDVYAFETT